MQLNPAEISELIKSRIEGLAVSADIRNQGTVVSVTDGICRVHGLSEAMQGEMLEFPAAPDGSATYGLALNLERDSVGAIILGEYEHISEGDTVKCTGRILEVPVGPELIGRVVNTLGEPIDGKGPINAKLSRSRRSRPASSRANRSIQPVQTGIMAIDAMIPIGRGQRELIIGDRATGKTTIAIDTIINQKGPDHRPASTSRSARSSRRQDRGACARAAGALPYTIIVAARPPTSAASQYTRAVRGRAIGEWFMDNGMDALIVYDDLSKHAVAYRQVSLVLNRPPGREAYPGDVFYLHSPPARARRPGSASENGNGSLTALPIIETQAGDVSAYIPTNVISITDGQIFLETDLFNQGIRPAISVGISVSRVGSAAQIKAMKQVAGNHRRPGAVPRARRLRAVRLRPRRRRPGPARSRQAHRRALQAEPSIQPRRRRGRGVAVIWAVQKGYVDDAVDGSRCCRPSGLRDLSRPARTASVKTIASTTKQLDKRRRGRADERRSTAFKKTFDANRSSATRSKATSHGSRRDIRRRIKSVKAPRQITKAMQMVAASKMRKAQEAHRAAPAVRRICRMPRRRRRARDARVRAPVPARQRPVPRRAAIIIVTTDKGLCGALNTNVSSHWSGGVDDLNAEGARRRGGRSAARARQFLARIGARSVSQAVQIARVRAQFDKRVAVGQGPARRRSTARADRYRRFGTRSIHQSECGQDASAPEGCPARRAA